ncbi:hypothetical protein PMAYCL1PPCAC_12039, partial [Pristionchus mayeri]
FSCVSTGVCYSLQSVSPPSNMAELIDEEHSESLVDLIVNPPENRVKGVIRLSYVNRNFPFMYLNPHTGVISGIYADMWKTLAKMENMEVVFERGTVYGGYTPDPTTEKFEGILGWLEEGRVDGISEEFTYRSSRMDFFYATTPIDYSVEAFYERTTSQVDDINNFIVFTPLIITLITISFIAINITERTVLVIRFLYFLTIIDRRRYRLGIDSKKDRMKD